MIFQHTWEQVLNGTKTQTRRLWDFGDWAGFDDAERNYVRHILWEQERGNLPQYILRRGRVWLRAGGEYAIQPGRGQKAIGRIRITAIRLERIGDINHGDCMAEGLTEPPYPSYDSIIENFAELWNSIHRKRGERWQDNPRVWALSSALVEE